MRVHVIPTNIGPTEKNTKYATITLFLILSMGYLILIHLVTANTPVIMEDAPPKVRNKTRLAWSRRVAGLRRGSGADFAREINRIVGKVMFVRKSDTERRRKRREEARMRDPVFGSLNQKMRGLRIVEIRHNKMQINMNV